MQLLAKPPIFFATAVIVSVVFSTICSVLILSKLNTRGHAIGRFQAPGASAVTVACHELSPATTADLLIHGIKCDKAAGLSRAAPAPNANVRSAGSQVRQRPVPRGPTREPIALIKEVVGGLRQAVGLAAPPGPEAASGGGQCPRTLLHIIYHKTGTVLSRSFYSLLPQMPFTLNHRVMTEEKAARIRAKFSDPLSRGAMFEVAGASHALSSQALYGNKHTFSCVGMFRDPYAMIISGYVYHQKVERKKEPWAHKRGFDPCLSRHNDVMRMGDFLYKEHHEIKVAAHRWHETCRALTKHAHSLWAQQQQPSGDRPAPEEHHAAISYTQMLQVLPPHQGIFLEISRALINTHRWGGSDLLRMAFTYEGTRQRECCLNIFMEDFERSFLNTSRCLLAFWRVEERSNMTLAQAVERSQAFDLRRATDANIHLRKHRTGSSKSKEGQEWIRMIKNNTVFGDILERIASVMARPALRRCS